MLSTHDSRYPTMYPVGRNLPGLSLREMREARRVGAAVANRTGTTCFYNSASGKLIWVYGHEPHGGPLGIRFRLPAGIMRYDDGEIDDMVRYIGRGKMKARQKDRLIASAQATEKNDQDENDGRRLESRRKDILDYAAHIERRRRGTLTTSVVV